MAIYRYQHESLVDTVHVLTNEKGGLRAYLYADNGADSDKLRILKQGLRDKGYKCVPTLSGGKPALEVRGFNKPDELLTYLDHMIALKGNPEIIAEASDKRTTKQKLEGATLKMAGLSYNIGDAAYMYYAAGPILKTAYKERKMPGIFPMLDILGAIGYSLGSFCLTFFGSKDQSINTITEATTKIERFARKEGYQISPESSIAFATDKPDRGIWGNLKHTIARYPSEALNSIYVGVGLCLSAASIARIAKPVEKMLTTEAGAKRIAEVVEEAIRNKKTGNELLEITKAAHEAEQEIVLKGVKARQESGKTLLEISPEEAHEKLISTDFAEKKFKEDKREHFWDKFDIGLGAVTATSAITGLVVKEQKRMDGDPKRHGVGAVIDWIREKPLRATGLGYLIATGFHTVATIGKWNNRAINGTDKKYLAGRAVFIAANIFSEAMLALSSKGHGIGVKPDNSINDSVMSAAAELVLRQPPEKREAIIAQMAGYIASPEVLAIKAEEAEKSIRAYISGLDKNPWTKHYVANANGVMVEAAPEQMPALLDQLPAPAAPDLSKLTPVPSTVVSNAEHISKHTEIAHAVA